MIFFPGVLAAGLLTDCRLYRRFHPVWYPGTIFLTLLSFAVLLKSVHDPFLILKGLIFAQSLIVIGYYDAKSHTIPDRLLIPVMACGLIDFQPVRSITGFFSLSILFFLVSWLTQGDGLGGGDVKLTAAAGFVLGPVANMAGTFTGILFFLIVYFVLFRKKKAYAMAPWLGTGCFFAYAFIH